MEDVPKSGLIESLSAPITWGQMYNVTGVMCGGVVQSYKIHNKISDEIVRLDLENGRLSKAVAICETGMITEAYDAGQKIIWQQVHAGEDKVQTIYFQDFEQHRNGDYIEIEFDETGEQEEYYESLSEADMQARRPMTILQTSKLVIEHYKLKL